MSYYPDAHSHEGQPYYHQSHDLYPPQPALARSNTGGSSTTTFVKHTQSSSDDLEFGKKEQSLSWDQPRPQQDLPPTKRWYQIFFPKSWPLRLYLAVVVFETIANLAIQADIFSRLGDSVVQAGTGFTGDGTKKVAVYLIIYVIAHLFQLGMAIEAVASQNTLQFIFLAAANLMFLVYSILQAVEIDEVSQVKDLSKGVTSISIKTLTILSHVIIASAEVAFLGLGWQIWRDFGWKVYKFLGADILMKKRFKHYQVFLCLIKFDLFFFMAFTTQLIFLVLKKDDWEYYMTIAAIPLAVLLLVEAYLAARHENKWLMGSFLLGCLVSCVYFAYKLFRVWERAETEFLFTKTSLTIFASISLFTILVTAIWGVIVMQNFGKGLKEALKKQTTYSVRQRKNTVKHINRTGNQAFPMSSNPNRMSID